MESPQEWLPQPHAAPAESQRGQELALRSVFQAVAQFPDLAEQALSEFPGSWASLPDLPLEATAPVTAFFRVQNGRSRGESNYGDGVTPYISSGDARNSIIRLVDVDQEECFTEGALTVTAFGMASLQPWPFMGRGNGGSAVRVLMPLFNMSAREFLWFAAQINMQRWRFHYARMAIKSRLERLVLRSPSERMPDVGESLASRLIAFRDGLNALSELS